ncbi:MAG: ATPase, T2SS/T4P/T4SS family [Marmoricola sp.]
MTDIDWTLVRRLQSEVGMLHQKRIEADRRAGHPELKGEDARQFVKALVESVVTAYEASRVETGGRSLGLGERADLVRSLEARLFGAGTLQQLLEDDQVEDISINGYKDVFVEYADGSKRRIAPICGSDEELVEQIQTLAAHEGLSARAFDAVNVRVNLRLADGSRLYAVQQVTKQPVVSIRKHRYAKATLKDLQQTDTITPELSEFLAAAVRAKKNVMISGAVKAGKTTLLRAMASEIDADERIITVERSLELGLDEDAEAHPNAIAMEERLANAEGVGHEPMSSLVRDSLRLNPSRVIVGEVLGDEVVTMLNAMTQGNNGSLSTIHANSAADVVDKITTYAAQAPERLGREPVTRLIASGLDFIVHIRLFPLEGSQRRVVTSVIEVAGINESGHLLTNELFSVNRDLEIERTAVRPRSDEDLREVGWRDNLPDTTTASGWV